MTLRSGKWVIELGEDGMAVMMVSLIIVIDSQEKEIFDT